MAREVTIGGSGALFAGEDKNIDIEVLDGEPDNAATLAVDITGWTLLLVIRDFASQADPVVLQLGGSVTGTYNSDPDINTQVARFPLTDTQSAALQPGTYAYSAKRTDDGSETVFAYGDFIVERATQI